MTEVLREPLSADQLRLLQVIFEPFDQDRGSPIWQYVDLTLDARYGIDAADVLASLPRVGEHGPTSMSYGLTWRGDSHLAPQPDTHVALTVAGLRYLEPDSEPVLGSFLVTVRHMVEAQRNLVPKVREVVDATVSSSEIGQQLTTWSIKGASGPPVEAMMKKVRWMLGHEPFLYNVVQQPKPDVEDWTVRVPAILRVYRDVVTLDDYLDCVIRQVAAFARQYGDEPAEVLQVVRRLAVPGILDADERQLHCPACESPGAALGDHEVDWDYERDEHGRHFRTHGKVWFNAGDFECRVCGLHLEDEAELAAAGVAPRWLVPDADPDDYDPGFDEDLLYEAWRDERREREEREEEERSDW